MSFQTLCPSPKFALFNNRRARFVSRESTAASYWPRPCVVAGLRWLTALLDSHPRSLCRTEPFDRNRFIGLDPVLRRLQKTGTLTGTERERLIDAWTNDALAVPPSLFFCKQFTEAGPVRQWWSWFRAGWSDRARRANLAINAPADHQPYDLVLTQTSNAERIATVARGLKARLLILRRHPGAVVASRLRGLRRGYLQPLDRVGWFDENERACRELELHLSSVLRMPLTELLAYQWLVQNMQFRSALSQLPDSSLAMQFEDFCDDPAARAASCLTSSAGNSARKLRLSYSRARAEAGIRFMAGVRAGATMRRCSAIPATSAKLGATS